MKNLVHKTPDHSRLSTIGHTLSEHSAEAGHKIRDEFDDVAPKVAAAASQAVHTTAHAAMERSRPIRTEAAARGSAALSGLLGEVTPAQIDRMSGRASRRGRIALLLTAAGGVLIWALWWKRSDPDLGPWQEELSKPDTEPAEDLAGPQSP
ncbi:DUF5324 family protein [Catenulispora sp. NF23]|uniref:DUF5324 family protein n=1 Tax=Catenulispora pinistramenti TaxID=2705254 RepID=UPI001BAE489F|nr:DUF5324 family protein [Catenulispora pinistramenti]MBS2532631.1 DUF5324 family protein [Catenulispora pinistramenti]